jgi:hypothetical protein
VIVAVVLAGCGSSHPGHSTSVAATITHSTSVAATVAHNTSAASTTAAPKFSKAQAASYDKACGYFSGDYAALTGELKMSDLTGAQLTEAARYVAEDLAAVRLPLDASQKAQLAQAGAVLASAEKTPGSQAVSSQEADSLSGKFQSAPFSTLSQTIKAACRYVPK